MKLVWGNICSKPNLILKEPVKQNILYLLGVLMFRKSAAKFVKI